MRDNRTQHETFQGACDLIRSDGGHVPVLISGGATFDAAGDVSEIVIVLSDISQILEIERMKEDFVANVTHELRTPLATILLYARLLRSGKTRGQPEREARYLEIIEQQSNQIQKLVRQILDLSRMEETVSYPRREAIHLPSVLKELLVPLDKLAHQKGLIIETDLPASLPTITSNREAVQLILRNLVDNAIKFTPKGKIRISARRCEETIAVNVSDDGIGIPPESMPHLFQRFYRTEAAVEQGIGGSGLGLALVKEATEKIGGSIQVESLAGRGSTFTVTLPMR
jgi:two-component system phosphate regulon sensor histidine kinase PhoR